MNFLPNTSRKCYLLSRDNKNKTCKQTAFPDSMSFRCICQMSSSKTLLVHAETFCQRVDNKNRLLIKRIPLVGENLLIVIRPLSLQQIFLVIVSIYLFN